MFDLRKTLYPYDLLLSKVFIITVVTPLKNGYKL